MINEVEINLRLAFVCIEVLQISFNSEPGSKNPTNNRSDCGHLSFMPVRQKN